MKLAKILLVALLLTPLAVAEVSVGIDPQTSKTVEPKESVKITADASGSNLESLKLYKKESDESFWYLESKDTSDCEDGYCVLSKQFSYPDGSIVEFKAEANPEIGEAKEDTVTIEWKEKDAKDDNQEPAVSLKKPSDGATSVSTSPTFEFTVADEDSSTMESVTLAVEEKDSQWDTPWSAPDDQEQPMKFDLTSEGEELRYDTSTYQYKRRFSFSGANLDPGTEYVWGVKADDGTDTGGKNTVYSFTTGKDTTDENKPPTADLDVSPVKGEKGSTFTFDASGSSDEDGSIDRYKFDFDGDGTVDKESSNPVVERVINDLGTKQPTVKVVDNDGAESEEATDIYEVVEEKKEENTKPNAVLEVTPIEGETGSTFTFNASESTDSEGNIVLYEWDFNGDGETDETTNDSVVERVREKTGTFYPRVRVIDEGDLSNPAYDKYTVTEAKNDTDGGDDKEKDEVPDITLKEPADGSEVAPTVNFTWLIEDGDDAEMQDTRLVVEEKNYNGDVPWNKGESHSVSNVANSVRSKTLELEENTIYVWGVKADDGDGYHRSNVFEFITGTAEDDDDGTDDGTDDDTDDKDDDDAVDEEDGSLEVDVEDEDGVSIDARVDIDGPEDESARTGGDGKILFKNLEPGDYEVTVSEPGYITEERDVEISAGEEEELDFTLEREREDVEVIYTRIPSTVCRGDDLTAEIGVRNNAGSEDLELNFYAGNSIAAKEVEIGRFSTETFRITAEDISGDSFNAVLQLENGEEREFRRTVDVRDCGDVGDITINVRPSTITYGEHAEVSGYVEGGEPREVVDVHVDGVKVAQTKTDRRGYYSVFIQPRDAGSQTVRVESDGRTAASTVNVKPTVSVASLKMPERVFESERFDVCAQVSSQVTPQVQLVRDGKVIDAKSEKGEVCFETHTLEVGEHDYGILASAHGVRSGREREIQVLENDSEVKTFPSKVATVRAEDGIVSVDVYNNRKEEARYDVEVGGLPETWFTTTDKSFPLSKGERKTVYFYFVPEREGQFRANIEVSRDGKEVHRTQVPIEADGTTQPHTWWGRLRVLFSSW